MSTYEMTVIREGRWWVGYIDGVRGAATESRRLSGLAPEMVDLLSGLFDLDPDDIRITTKYQFAPAAEKRLSEYREAAEARDRAQAAYEQAQRDVVLELRHEGVSLRDSAELMGVSFQRVQQIS